MYKELKKKVEKELEQLISRGEMNMSTMERMHKMTDIIKNCDKIEMLESDGGYSETGSSYARGRGRNARRDSMGRYAYDMGGYSDDGYSEEASSYRGGYSRHDAKDHMMSKIGEMMEGADPHSREVLKKCMRDLERE